MRTHNASRLQSSVKLHWIHLGLKGALEAASSQRITGPCFSEFVKKGRTRRKAPLSVLSVLVLESIVQHGTCTADRIVAGACLLGVLGRLRWSDVLKVRKIAIDREEDGSGYLECEHAR